MQSEKNTGKTMIFHRENRKLLGCHCIGSGATELIHVGQAVLGLGGGLDYFLNTIFNYPTIQKLAVEIAQRMGIPLDGDQTAVAAGTPKKTGSLTFAGLTDEQAIEALAGRKVRHVER